MSLLNFAKMRPTVSISLKSSWSIWGDRNFRIKLIISVILAIILLAFLPFFFQIIEKRKGLSLNDPILAILTAQDVSIGVFFIIWSSALFLLTTILYHPKQFLTFLTGYIIITCMRLMTIYFLPLEPPPGLIPLKDPLSNSFYGASFITKDLFFSGHTSTLFLIVLCLQKQWQRIYSGFGVCVLAVLLLVQHVHYTIDVIFAFPFTYISYLLGRRLVAM